MKKSSFFGWGQPVPWFHAHTPVNANFDFSSLGGRFVLLAFFGSGQNPSARPFLETLKRDLKLPADEQFVAFAVSRDEEDQTTGLIAETFVKRRVFHDPNLTISQSYNMLEHTSEGIHYHGGWYLLDPMLRVYDSGTLGEADRLVTAVRALPPAEDHAETGQSPWAPVLMVPRVLPPAFCRHLIDLYKRGAPSESGFMREENGRTVPVINSTFKRRQDIQIEDQETRDTLNRAIYHRLKPEIMKTFQFDVTRIERYIVAHYGENDGGFFRSHRDNTTAGTAHRRFAVSINLNAEEFDGGELRFPEFGNRTYRPPTGGAVVFSCSLLHEATPVTKGDRFATLPFLYDEAAAQIRVKNQDKVGRLPETG